MTSSARVVIFLFALLVAAACSGKEARLTPTPQVGSPAFLLKWGMEGDGDGQFRGPVGVATDAQGNIYVADNFNFNFRVQKFGAGP